MIAPEIVEKVKELRPSTQHKDDILLDWIYRVDKKIREEIHGKSDEEFEVLELAVPEEYSDIYVYFVIANLHFYNGEYDKYSNVITQYNTLLDEYAKKYIREHRPSSNGVKVW